MKQGIEQGEKKNKIEVAKKLLKLEMPIDKIMEITELPKEKIEELIDS